MGVFALLQHYCKDATFHLYRTIAEDRLFTPQNMLKALDAARNAGVDLLNVSAGKHRPDCNQNCRLCVAAKRIINDGVCVVAGAGNRRRDEPLSLFCPALQDDVISVGAYEAVCTTDVGGEQPLHRQTPTIRPNGSYWLSPPSESDGWYGYPRDHYCGYLGCTPDISCENNRLERPWERNISYQRGQPDVLAPCHQLDTTSDGEPFLASGTSYAAPIVTGSLAMILGELFNRGKNPNPKQIQRAIVGETVPIDKGPVGKLNVEAVLNRLS
ncbi:S8 family serine peptidase [Halococcus hamelinensis]|uniref:S8 family serine peptidase n=1 Tax=Halococcus hamelinensis TaxID=332168 RepID=UPI00373AEF83